MRDSTGNIDEGIIYTITSYYVAHYKLFNLEIASFIYFNEQVGPDFLTDGVLSSPLLFKLLALRPRCIENNMMGERAVLIKNGRLYRLQTGPLTDTQSQNNVHISS